MHKTYDAHPCIIQAPSYFCRRRFRHVLWASFDRHVAGCTGVILVGLTLVAWVMFSRIKSGAVEAAHVDRDQADRQPVVHPQLPRGFRPKRPSKPRKKRPSMPGGLRSVPCSGMPQALLCLQRMALGPFPEVSNKHGVHRKHRVGGSRRWPGSHKPGGWGGGVSVGGVLGSATEPK